jgi:hypothetical protein
MTAAGLWEGMKNRALLGKAVFKPVSTGGAWGFLPFALIPATEKESSDDRPVMP